MEFFDHKDNWAAKRVKVGKINFVILSDRLTLSIVGIMQLCACIGN